MLIHPYKYKEHPNWMMKERNRKENGWKESKRKTFLSKSHKAYFHNA